MSSVKPNDNAKVVVLIVAVVAVIGFAGYRVLGTQGKPIEDAGAAVERIDAPDAGSASGGSGGEVVSGAALPLSSIDPFGKHVPEAPPIIPVATRSTSSRPIRAYDPPIREFGGDLRL